MPLLKRMNKILRINNLAKIYSDDVILTYKSMQVKINKFKEVMDNLSKTRRKCQAEERNELVEQMFRILSYIENSYNSYLADLDDLCKLLNNNPEISLTPKIKHQVSIALNTKTKIKDDCNTIYRNFKSMVKKLDNIPMKEILTQMREVFDFNKADFNSEKSQSYYDSTTMQIRRINI